MAKKLTETQVKKSVKAINTNVRKLTMDKIDYGTLSNVSVSVEKLLDVNKTLVRMLKGRSRLR